MKHVIIEDEMYRQNLNLIWNCSYEEQKKYIKDKYDFEVDTGPCDGARFSIEIEETKQVRFVIWLKEYSGTVFEEKILVHELFHQVMDVMDFIGMKFELCVSEEAYAYYFEHLYEQCILALTKKKK